MVQRVLGLPQLPNTPAVPSAPPTMAMGPMLGGVGGMYPPHMVGDGGLSAVVAGQVAPFIGPMLGAALQKQQFLGGPAAGSKRKRGPSTEEVKQSKEAQKQANIDRDRQQAEEAATRREARRREHDDRMAEIRRVRDEREASRREANLGAQGRYERDLEALGANLIEFAVDRRLADLAREGRGGSDELERLRGRSRSLVALWVSERRQSGHIRQVASFFQGPRADAPAAASADAAADAPEANDQEAAQEGEGGDKTMSG